MTFTEGSTTVTDEELTAQLAEALFAHRRTYVHFRTTTGDGQRFAGCTCGWKLTWPKPSQSQPVPPPAETFEHHRAAALASVVREQAAETWEEGRCAGWRDAQRNEEARIYNGRELDEDELTPNPYRAAALSEETDR